MRQTALEKGIPKWYRDIHIGDTVSYRDPSLWQSKGTLVRFSNGPNGGNCWVKWAWTNIESEEMLENLFAWR